MHWTSVELTETNFHDSLAYDQEFWKKAIKMANHEQGSGKNEDDNLQVVTDKPHRIKVRDLKAQWQSGFQPRNQGPDALRYFGA